MHKNRHHKIITLIVVLIQLISIRAHAQYPTVRETIINLPTFDDRFLHYGYFVGLNSYDFKFSYHKEYYTEKFKDIELIPSMGFNVGLIGDLRINKYINIRIEPGLYYSKRDLIFPEHSIFTDESDRLREVKSTYIHIPLIVKLSAARINNFRPFVLVGISKDFNLSSNHKNIDDNFSNVFRTEPQNMNYEIGLGLDFYLFYFKFSPSIRGIFSMQNELIPDSVVDPLSSPWTGGITKMVSRGFAINLTFE
ncbi:MAG: porin family protein [Bacteroidota bacterium]|nr:porin family protein [Bacteroidota bacterium]